jgi:hypothetical protein
MLEMSYKYISSSNTTASRFRLSLTARTAEGNVSSHIIDDRFQERLAYGACFERGEDAIFNPPTLVFWITRCRGDSMRATREVEKSISMIATFPSLLLNIFAKGSV